uniref:Nuclear distribution protein nudE-like protein n=2 Tax=Hirondellea gigas TaxID=1518452 RepID=A0A6A7FTL2_9CRUS
MSSDSEDERNTFKSHDEEVRYWRNKAVDYKKRLYESQQELEEYQSHSSELEAELEAELEQAQSRCSELRHQVVKLATENEIIKDRLSTQSVALEGRVDNLEEELQDVRSIKDGFTTYIRQLEQANDDLERAKRATLTSLEDFETRLNQAIERNAFLESELDEKEGLKEMVQRLKDESRDLRQEVIVRKVRTPPDISGMKSNAAHDNDKAAAAFNNSKHQLFNGTANIAENLSLNGMKGGEPPLTPSARISALNIVGDLLRKVGALESRLASCRSLVKDNQRNVSMTPPAGNPSAR